MTDSQQADLIEKLDDLEGRVAALEPPVPDPASIEAAGGARPPTEPPKRLRSRPDLLLRTDRQETP